MNRSFRLEIVSPEQEIFSGRARKLFVTGTMGELEILYGHAPLLTGLAPGVVWIVKEDGSEEGLVVNGGFLEVQPEATIVLADVAIRAEDIDEAKAKEIQTATEHKISSKTTSLDYDKAHSELAMAAAELRLIKNLRNLHGD